jgi:hypothetical protein
MNSTIYIRILRRITVRFTESMLSAPRRWRDNNAETCRTYVKEYV